MTSPAVYGQDFLRGIVGLRVTVTDVRPATLQVDFAVTAYTRHRSPNAGPPSGNPIQIGTSIINLAAIDFGDGSTRLLETLPLVGVFSGPNGYHVYRGSFSHTYPFLHRYEIRVGSHCYCRSVRYYRARTTAPSINTYYYRSARPSIPTGRPFLTITNRSTNSFPPYINRRFVYEILALTNSAVANLAAAPIPSLSVTALVILGLSLAAVGTLLLRR